VGTPLLARSRVICERVTERLSGWTGSRMNSSTGGESPPRSRELQGDLNAALEATLQALEQFHLRMVNPTHARSSRRAASDAFSCALALSAQQTVC